MFSLRLTRKHRDVFGEKILDLAHLSAGILIFSQFAGPQLEIRSLRLIVGIVMVIFFYGVSYQLLKPQKGGRR